VIPAASRRLVGDDVGVLSDFDDRLRSVLSERGIADWYDRLRSAALPSFLVHVDSASNESSEGDQFIPPPQFRLGGTRFGGTPDLPRAARWPVNANGRHLVFVGQVDLAELPATGHNLPPSGLLSFFVGVDEPANDVDHRVFYFAEPDLVPTVRPSAATFVDRSGQPVSHRPVALRITESMSLPTDNDYFGDDEVPLHELQHDLDGVTVGFGYEESRLLGHLETFIGSPAQDAYLYKSGRADIVYLAHLQPGQVERQIQEARDADRPALVSYYENQRDEYEAAAAAMAWWRDPDVPHEAEMADWQLLLSVDSHRAAGMCWWDAGSLNFAIRGSDLAAGRFDDTYAWIGSG